ncbi:MAG: hypothetical protein ACI9UD_002901 [Glaciecola sp.]|jgi:hypothetical protein
MNKSQDISKHHFQLTKKNVLIVVAIFIVCIGLPMLILLNL